jgi:hypothetical protein
MLASERLTVDAEREIHDVSRTEPSLDLSLQCQPGINCEE